MKLLIVDDSLIMRKAVERSLADKEFTLVGTAQDGAEALRIFSETLPDFVTLDITMPKLDGLSCLTEMLKIKPDTKILMITSQSDNATAEEVISLGASGILHKPFSSDQIVEKVNKILGT